MNHLCFMMGIPLLDHVIVGGNNKAYFSFNRAGLLPTPRVCLKSDYHQLNFSENYKPEHFEYTSNHFESC